MQLAQTLIPRLGVRELLDSDVCGKSTRGAGDLAILLSLRPCWGPNRLKMAVGFTGANFQTKPSILDPIRSIFDVWAQASISGPTGPSGPGQGLAGKALVQPYFLLAKKEKAGKVQLFLQGGVNPLPRKGRALF